MIVYTRPYEEAPVPGANAVWKSAMSRASYPKASRSTRRATVRDGSGTTVNSSLPGMHLATSGPGSSAAFPNAKAEARTFRPFAPPK
jgi:hypothetical protein